MTYNLRVLQATTGMVYASILGTRGYPVPVATTRVDTYTGETVVVTTQLRTRNFETSIEQRIAVSTFIGTRPAGLLENPVQLAVLSLILGGGTGAGALAMRLRHRSRREKPPSAVVPAKPMPEAPSMENAREKVSGEAEYERYLKRLDELRDQGKISEKIYERLKKKYQADISR